MSVGQIFDLRRHMTEHGLVAQGVLSPLLALRAPSRALTTNPAGP